MDSEVDGYQRDSENNMKDKSAVKWGSAGGKATLKKKGRKHFALIANIRWGKQNGKNKKNK